MTDGTVKRRAIPTPRRPEPEGVDTGTPEAPIDPENRSERATRAPGDMHEPPPYPAHRLHFEEEDFTD